MPAAKRSISSKYGNENVSNNIYNNNVKQDQNANEYMQLLAPNRYSNTSLVNGRHVTKNLDYPISNETATTSIREAEARSKGILVNSLNKQTFSYRKLIFFLSSINIIYIFKIKYWWNFIFASSRCNFTCRSKQLFSKICSFKSYSSS